MKKKKNSKKFERKHKIVFALAVGLSVIMFWRGAWGLMDLYLFPHSPTFSFIASIIIGLCILYFSKHAAKELMDDG